MQIMKLATDLAMYLAMYNLPINRNMVNVSFVQDNNLMPCTKQDMYFIDFNFTDNICINHFSMFTMSDNTHFALRTLLNK